MSIISSINFPAALAKGVFNLFRLKSTAPDKKEYLLVILTKDRNVAVPILGTRAYLGTDEELGDKLEPIVNLVIHDKVFGEHLPGSIKIIYKDAPAHSHEILSQVTVKGACKYEKLDEVLSELGYTIIAPDIKVSTKIKDYSELVKKDPFAKAILAENKAELEAVGATFDTLNDETKIAYEGLAKGKYLGLIFAGPTGTGKSWAGRILANHMKAPYLTLQIDHGTMVDTLVGSFVPKAGEKVKEDTAEKILETLRDPKLSVSDALNEVQKFLRITGEGSKWEFIPGPLLKAFTEGWIIILEEVNFGDPGVLAKLNEFTDGTLRVTVNGIPYKRHPNFLVIMTMNPGYAGTDPLNVALKGRFAKVNVPALTKEQFTTRMIGYSRGLGHALSVEFFSRLYDFAAAMESLGNDSTFHEDVKFSVRNAQRLCDCILSKPRTLEEFTAAISIQYLNDLTMDNDNSDRVENLKKDTNTVNSITSLYTLYDFAEVPTTNELLDLNDFVSFSEGTLKDDGVTIDASDLLDDSELDTLLGGM